MHHHVFIIYIHVPVFIFNLPATNLYLTTPAYFFATGLTKKNESYSVQIEQRLTKASAHMSVIHVIFRLT